MGRSQTRGVVTLEHLEDRRLLSSVGWDGPGQGSAELTYYLGPTPAYLAREDVQAAIESALAAWSEVINVEFTETSQPNRVDSIDFLFRQIDGRNGTLAQAYFPDDVNPARIAGDVQFDTSERWEIGNEQGRSAFDLVLVATHEIGHSLGLEHSHHADAVLRSSVSANAQFTGLATDDIDAALELYAPAKLPTPSLPPTITPDLVHTELPSPEDHENDPAPRSEEAPRPVPRWLGYFLGWNRYRTHTFSVRWWSTTFGSSRRLVFIDADRSSNFVPSSLARDADAAFSDVRLRWRIG